MNQLTEQTQIVTQWVDEDYRNNKQEEACLLFLSPDGDVDQISFGWASQEALQSELLEIAQEALDQNLQPQFVFFVGQAWMKTAKPEEKEDLLKGIQQGRDALDYPDSQNMIVVFGSDSSLIEQDSKNMTMACRPSENANLDWSYRSTHLQGILASFWGFYLGEKAIRQADS